MRNYFWLKRAILAFFSINRQQPSLTAVYVVLKFFQEGLDPS
jgi:hypothetical protein